MEGWTRKNGHVVAKLSQQEAAVIRGLVGQLKDMLAARAAEAPQDELAELTEWAPAGYMLRVAMILDNDEPAKVALPYALHARAETLSRDGARATNAIVATLEALAAAAAVRPKEPQE